MLWVYDRYKMLYSDSEGIDLRHNFKRVNMTYISSNCDQTLANVDV